MSSSRANIAKLNRAKEELRRDVRAEQRKVIRGRLSPIEVCDLNRMGGTVPPVELRAAMFQAGITFARVLSQFDNFPRRKYTLASLRDVK